MVTSCLLTNKDKAKHGSHLVDSSFVRLKSKGQEETQKQIDRYKDEGEKRKEKGRKNANVTRKQN